MRHAFRTLALCAILASTAALARTPMETNQLVDDTGTPIGTPSNPLNVVGSGGSGSSTVTGSQEQDVRSSGTLSAATANAAITLPINGQATVGLTFTGLTFTGLAASGATVTFEQSNDGGTTWTGVNEVNAGTGVPSATRNTDGQTRVAVQGRTNLRIRVSTTGAGTITVASNISVREGLVTLASPVPPGSNAIGSVLADLRVSGAANAISNPIFAQIASGTVTLGAGSAQVGSVVQGPAATDTSANRWPTLAYQGGTWTTAAQIQGYYFKCVVENNTLLNLAAVTAGVNLNGTSAAGLSVGVIVLPSS